jgi:hypothetical protein
MRWLRFSSEGCRSRAALAVSGNLPSTYTNGQEVGKIRTSSEIFLLEAKEAVAKPLYPY